MENDKTLYSDVMLQLLSAYMVSESMEDRLDDVSTVLFQSIEDEEIGGPGLLSGLIFASIIHMSLLLDIVSMSNECSKEDALRNYALSYSLNRDQLSELPQLNPSFVNEIMKRLM